VALFVTAFYLYSVLSDKPFGAQLAITIGYTGAVFLFVFFRWRGLPQSYSLRDKRVQQRLPWLVAIHISFVIFLLAAVRVWSLIRPQLPSSWLAERGRRHESYHEWALIVFYTLTFYTQVYISRRILKRSTKP
jgi:NADH:ubiquinone oxidoreductase subunit 6 (subunit J)